jgi:O-acetylhomoserine/O-acetylserine sulfhydrylase-like pyridoxal-dependent enzyme
MAIFMETKASPLSQVKVLTFESIASVAKAIGSSSYVSSTTDTIKKATGFDLGKLMG